MAVGAPRYGKRGFKRLSDAAKPLIRKPLARRGFAQARLLTEWEAVVGAHIAALCRPIRLSHAAKEGLGGTLTLGVPGARAIEAQHMEPQIVERVNAHYGYRAVARLRLTQMPPDWFERKTPPAPDTPVELDDDLKSALSPIQDEGLRAALEHLGRNIASHARAESGRRPKKEEASKA